MATEAQLRAKAQQLADLWVRNVVDKDSTPATSAERVEFYGYVHQYLREQIQAKKEALLDIIQPGWRG